MSPESFSNHNKKVESAVSSMKQAQIERWSGMMDDSLSAFNDYYPGEGEREAIMKQMIESGRTDQEKQAIETTITIIERYLSSNDKYSILSGATKQLPEIATAYRALNHSASSLFLGVLQRLENAVGACATEEEASAAHEAMGLMSDEEVQNAKEMISKMSINGSSTNNDARP